MALASHAVRLGRGGCLELLGVVVFALLLGAFAASAWLHHREQALSRVEPGPADSITSARPVVDRSRIRVDVRNGSGLEGAAIRMTEFIREQGFDVVDFGNADRFDHARTFVIDRSGTPGAAREVATALQGVPIGTAADTSRYLDVTVVVGRDLEAVLARRAEPVHRVGWRRWLDKLPWR